MNVSMYTSSAKIMMNKHEIQMIELIISSPGTEC